MSTAPFLFVYAQHDCISAPRYKRSLCPILHLALTPPHGLVGGRIAAEEEEEEEGEEDDRRRWRKMEEARCGTPLERHPHYCAIAIATNTARTMEWGFLHLLVQHSGERSQAGEESSLDMVYE